MNKTELKQLIKEEIKVVLKESNYTEMFRELLNDIRDDIANNVSIHDVPYALGDTWDVEIDPISISAAVDAVFKTLHNYDLL